MDVSVPCPAMCRMTHTESLCSATHFCDAQQQATLFPMDFIYKNSYNIFFSKSSEVLELFVPALGAPAPGEGRGWWAVGAGGAGVSVGTAGAAGPGARTLMMAAAPSGSRGETWTLQHLCSLPLQHKHTGGKPRNQAENMKAHLPILPLIKTFFPCKPGDSPGSLFKIT